MSSNRMILKIIWLWENYQCMLIVVRRTTADIHLELEASRAVCMRMELGVRLVRRACINTDTSDQSGRRDDRSLLFYVPSRQYTTERCDEP